MKFIKKLSDKLFSTSAAGLYMLLFAIAIGAATFVENDYGTSSAQKIIFKTRWFELLMLLFTATIVVNIFRFRMIQAKKWAILAFHASMIVIFIGAGVTRYFGYEGMMHIRENDSSNSFLSADTYLLFETVLNDTKYSFNEPVLFATLGNNNFKNSYLLGGEEISVEVTDFIPNPKEELIADENGLPTVQIVIGGANGREEYYLQKGDRARIRGTFFNFSDMEMPSAFNIKLEDGMLFFKTNQTYLQTQMATQKKDTIQPGAYSNLLLRSLYTNGVQSFVFGKYLPMARVEMISEDRKMLSSSTAGLKVRVSNGTDVAEDVIYGMKGAEGRPRSFKVGNVALNVAYGSKRIDLPFSLKLRDFKLEKYPGTSSASSYESEVTLIDPRNGLKEDSRIFMNNILNYGGYRFFQSSFDQDELGTYLSVNHDFWGTWISYLGYFILTVGMIMTFFDKKSRFRTLAKKLEKMREHEQKMAAVFIGLVLAFSTPIFAAPPIDGDNIEGVNYEHAERFGEMVMQDHRGRMKPMNTYTNEILRKLSRKETLYGLTPEQIILGMATNPKDWYDIPLIKRGKHQKTTRLLGDGDGLLSYADFFNKDGSYKLREAVRDAYNTAKKDRGVFEKEMMKLDEKVNICSMVFSGSFMKMFPVPGDKNNLWESPVNAGHGHNHTQSADTYSKKFYSAYIPTLKTSLVENDWNLANRMLDELTDYQKKFGAAVMPSDTRLKAELWLNELNVFPRLAKWFAILGLLFLGLLFADVFKPGMNLKIPNKIALAGFVGLFLFYAFGMGLRWYVSGRAPWSNGYESMIYIGFTTTLAGLIFSRKSNGGLGATSILASTLLLVAGLSWADPEITPLVPVLKSYWLTIHVSLEAGSYGFLMLGALIGVINLLFMIFKTQNNAKNVNRIIKEMTMISEMTLIGGLFMISIGTYLGGVWANESWGRYWGWDAKETWALVTILVYAFILHMRFIPGMKSAYAFNVATLFGWASVIMTYFGVNYYLSGLHSYAAGDPVPIPSWVYYAVAVLTVIGLVAWWRERRFRKVVK